MRSSGIYSLYLLFFNTEKYKIYIFIIFNKINLININISSIFRWKISKASIKDNVLWQININSGLIGDSWIHIHPFAFNLLGSNFLAKVYEENLAS